MRSKFPTIGIPAARQEESKGNYVYQRVGEPYIEAIENAGGCALILPVTSDAGKLRCMIERIDGVLLPGGGDVFPGLYGERQSIAIGVDKSTDRFEIELCNAALQMDMPLLAICRGIHILNVASGGTLIQDIATELNTPVNHRQSAAREKCTHGVKVDPNSKLAQIVGATEFGVNSFHHQAIQKVGRGLKVVARAVEDDIIEGLESPDHSFVIGVQFHPEEICNGEKPSAALFQGLLDAATSR